MTRLLVAALTVVTLSAQNPAPPPAAPDATCPEMATALPALVGNDARVRDWAILPR